MNKRVIGLISLLGSALMLAGCSGSGAAWTGANVGKNLIRKDTHLKIMLDGKQAKQNTLKKGATGYSRFDVKEPVSTSPTLRFEIEDPDRFGRITMVSCSIYQKFEADYSHQAEYTVIARETNNPQAQLKPGVDYNLGNLGPNFKIINLTGQEVPQVKLVPGMKYMLTFTVSADKSETAQIYFET